MPAESQPVPPKISAPPSLTAFAAIVLGATALGAGAVVFFFNPSTHGFYPVCLFHALTGWNCPGCGGTRAAYALLHGNIRACAEGQRAVCCCAHGGGRARQLVRNQATPAAAGRGVFAGEVFVGLARRRRGFHGVAESAGVCVSLALNKHQAGCGTRLAGARGEVWMKSEPGKDRMIDGRMMKTKTILPSIILSAEFSANQGCPCAPIFRFCRRAGWCSIPA